MKFLVLSILVATMAVMARAAPAGFVPAHSVYVGVHHDDDDDDHSLEDIFDDSLEDHLDRLRYLKHPHDVILDRHLDRVEDILEDHYGVDLDNLFEDDHHRLRLKYVLKPSVYTSLHTVPAIIRKYFSRPALTYSVGGTTSHVVVPADRTTVVTTSKKVVPVAPASTATTTGTKSVSAVDTAGTSVTIDTSPTGAVGVSAKTASTDPEIPPEVVKEIVDEEVKDAVEDIAENPSIDVAAKAKEVAKEIAEEKRDFKEDAFEKAMGIDVDDVKESSRPIRTP